MEMFFGARVGFYLQYETRVGIFSHLYPLHIRPSHSSLSRTVRVKSYVTMRVMGTLGSVTCN